MAVRGIGAWSAAIAAALALPALAPAAHAKGGTFTSTQADIHVAGGGAAIRQASVNCRLRNGVTVESIMLYRPVPVASSGAFTYRGPAFYVHQTATGYASTPTSVTFGGRFSSPTQIEGSIRGGPDACRAVRFAATYNPHAH